MVFISGSHGCFVNSPGKVQLTGVFQVPWEKSAAERAELDVEGVKSVENQIEIAGR
ncbi:MAG: BON domain-containing protein [Smithellaceae bacterium]